MTMRVVLKRHLSRLHRRVTTLALAACRITKFQGRGGHDISHFVLLRVAPAMSPRLGWFFLFLG